ncbi:MAG TPA: peptide chain release factor N(5)-glutamine methyltransferase [Candidatus Polarisedimenticolia bacterium]|nr:peptide chain release factor N(5)-glutamine methyltransferase [Candidatus Polarisedimenticolia bacterium]
MTAGSPATLGDLAREGAGWLMSRSVPSARFDAEVLLAHALGTDRGALLGRQRESIPPGVETSFRTLLGRRGDRVPLQHLTGRQEFWSLEFSVDARVLIPRPETELIVEEVLARVSSKSPQIADIGTGSGNIAVALAWELPSARILATDLSPDALEVARGNAARHGVGERIHFLQGDLAAPLEQAAGPGVLEFLVSNPPYVAEDELAAMEPEVRAHEPRAALTPGADPLRLYPALLTAGTRFLRSGGHLILELPAGGAEKIEVMVRGEISLELVKVRSDHGAIPRVLVARRR